MEQKADKERKGRFMSRKSCNYVKWRIEPETGNLLFEQEGWRIYQYNKDIKEYRSVADYRHYTAKEIYAEIEWIQDAELDMPERVEKYGRFTH